MLDLYSQSTPVPPPDSPPLPPRPITVTPAAITNKSTNGQEKQEIQETVTTPVKSAPIPEVVPYSYPNISTEAYPYPPFPAPVPPTTHMAPPPPGPPPHIPAPPINVFPPYPPGPPHPGPPHFPMNPTSTFYTPPPPNPTAPPPHRPPYYNN